jgi:2-oxoisovalerate dehydrogenase E1 component alpha subunit
MLSPDVLRHMLRNMTLLRAFDDRMFRAQRQGKTSFYMKAPARRRPVAAAMALGPDDMCFPSYRQQGILIRAAIRWST